MSNVERQRRVDGKHVVVTGSARGLGKAIAERLVSEGARVTCWDIDPSVLETASGIRAGGGQAHAEILDLTDPEGTEAAYVGAEEALGPVGVLVACAGGAAGLRTSFLDMDLDAWEDMLRRNLTTVFISCSVVARRLAKRGEGSIVVISSTSAEVASPGLVHYGAAKGAVRQLVRGMAIELGPYGVRVNAVAPGVTRTEGNAEILSRLEDDHPLRTRAPLGRFADPTEIAGAVVYLASDDASFTTGATIAVDGGFTVA